MDMLLQLLFIGFLVVSTLIYGIYHLLVGRLAKRLSMDLPNGISLLLKAELLFCVSSVLILVSLLPKA